MHRVQNTHIQRDQHRRFFRPQTTGQLPLTQWIERQQPRPTRPQISNILRQRLLQKPHRQQGVVALRSDSVQRWIHRFAYRNLQQESRGVQR